MIQTAIAISDYVPEETEGYLSFQKNDILSIQMFYENGWCYGYLQADDTKTGYIPINHVQLLQQEQQQALQFENQNYKLNDKQKKDIEWLQYVSSLMQDNQVIQNQVFEQPKQPEFQQLFLPYSESAWGYENFHVQKKVKVGEYLPKQHSEAKDVIPNKEAQNSKQYRQINHYFDYDKWVDYVNKTGQIPKGKPDAKRKNKKKFKLKIKENEF